MTRVTHIWRHPIKSHGIEALNSVDFLVDQCLPRDRYWAVAHDAAKLSGNDWVSCANFSRGAKAPKLMAIKARLDEHTGDLTLTHPDLAPLTFDPEQDQALFLEWVAPLMPPEGRQSARIVTAGTRGMTDTNFASVSLLSTSSNQALSEQMGQSLSPLRWRGNIWFDGLPAWEEFDWIGKRLRIGGAELEVREAITRCKATMANPDTGARDADTLGALNALGHQEFGVYASVTKPGRVAVGDMAEVL